MKTLIYKTCLFIMFVAGCCGATAQYNIDSLKKVLQTEKEDSNKVNTLTNICDYYWYAGDYKNDMEIAEAVLKLSEKINYKTGIAAGYVRTGLAYNLKKDRFNETECFSKALNLYKETNDKQSIIDCYDWMNAAYLLDLDKTKAFESVYAAQKIREQTGDKKTIADGLLYIAGTFATIGSNNLPEELKNELIALQLYKELNDKKNICEVDFMIANVYSRQKKYAEALDKCAEATQTFKSNGSSDDIANILWLTGDIYEQQGDSAYNNQNQNFAKYKYRQANKNELISLQTWQMESMSSSVVGCYYSLGRINIKLKNLNIAKEYLDSGFIIAKSLGLKNRIAEIYESYAQIDSVKSDYKEAYKNYRLYKIYYDSSNNEEDEKKAVQVQMQYYFDKKEVAAKAEQDKKDADAKRIKNQQYYAIAALGIIVLAVLIIALIQFRNNKQKQKVNNLITQQKQQVETTLSELKSTQQQLIQSEKMASLGELTAGIAHEIQNPLNFVNNFSEVNKELLTELKDEADKGNLNEVKAIASDVIDNEEKINHHGKRADAIVKGMLQHSRQTKGVKEPTDINALCDEYLHLNYHGLRAKDKNFNADFKTEFDKNVGKVNILPQDIGRVLLNIFNNAFYATNEKQNAKNLTQEEYKPLVSAQTKKSKDKIEIIISDNGNGIPLNIIDKIFQPFFTTKPTGQGTGLGLSLAYDIITKEHNGTIKVESRENEGSAFIINLPVV